MAKHIIVLTILLFGVWAMLVGISDPPALAAGGAVALITALVFGRGVPLLADVRLSPKAITFSIIYFFVFLKALLMANLDVARRVLSPSLPINPGIVAVKTKLKTPLGRLVLANSITLTPGTLSVESRGDTYYIHWIDASGDTQAASEAIVSGFERYLEVMYG